VISIAADDTRIGQPEISLAAIRRLPPRIFPPQSACITLPKWCSSVSLWTRLGRKTGARESSCANAELMQPSILTSINFLRRFVALAFAKRALRDAVGDQFEKALCEVGTDVFDGTREERRYGRGRSLISLRSGRLPGNNIRLRIKQICGLIALLYLSQASSTSSCAHQPSLLEKYARSFHLR
jgi:hypothetical protein